MGYWYRVKDDSSLEERFVFNAQHMISRVSVLQQVGTITAKVLGGEEPLLVQTNACTYLYF